METVPTDEEKLEKVARELCLAGGKNPDAMVRLGEPLSYAAGECTIVKPLFVPAWKTYSREARRLAMSDAEHAESSVRGRKPRRKPIVRLLCSPRMLAVVLRRRFRPLQMANPIACAAWRRATRRRWPSGSTTGIFAARR
jgi:hypothetical protein